MGLDNIDREAIGLAATGIVIVFVALTLVSLFIAWLPRMLGAINEIFPEPVDHFSVPPAQAAQAEEVDEALVAAIGFVLHGRGGS